MTKREAILQSVTSAMHSISGFSGSVYRSLSYALSRGDCPAIIVEPVSDAPVRNAVGRTEWTFTFQVTLLVRADIPESTGDTTAESIHSGIMALQSGLQDLVPSNVSWDASGGDKPLGAIVMQFKCLYQTSESSLSST